jgi:hypothetical protein
VHSKNEDRKWRAKGRRTDVKYLKKTRGVSQEQTIMRGVLARLQVKTCHEEMGPVYPTSPEGGSQSLV